jgi:8-oxo-dGTP pyrophosphatase MutT (NUDIX family)
MIGRAMSAPAESCGVVLLNTLDELLVCRTTGRGRWDLPKGSREVGEPSIDAAVRELEEETSLCIDGTLLVPVGEFDYLPTKRLHLFGVLVPKHAVDLRLLRCRTTFLDHATGLSLPEVDAYAWQPIADLPSWCGPNLSRVLRQVDWKRLHSGPVLTHVGYSRASE